MILSSPQPSGDMVAMECMLFECAERGAGGMGHNMGWVGGVCIEGINVFHAVTYGDSVRSLESQPNRITELRLSFFAMG